MSEISIEQMTETLHAIGENAVRAGRALAILSTEEKRACLGCMADALEAEGEKIVLANAKDLAQGEANGLSRPMLDRLRLDSAGVKAMADGLREVARQDDPVGKVLSSSIRPNGLKIEKITVPLGVIAIIYESRPNVTSDAAGICLMAGNSCILRGGSEAFNSNRIIAETLNNAAINSGLPPGAVQLVPWTDRTAINILLKMDRYIDLVIPRGGEKLIRMVTENSTIPVIKHYKGVCHLLVDQSADLDMALKIVDNSKCQRPSACNALETLLINRTVAEKFLPGFLRLMRERGVTLRGNEEAVALGGDQIELMEESGYYTEYLDYTLSVKFVSNVEEAVEHINQYGSRHSDGIVSNDEKAVKYFFANIDAATLYHNASTRFTDGGEFGMGAEIGISTDKIHARGPMGANELVSYKFLVTGSGQVR